MPVIQHACTHFSKRTSCRKCACTSLPRRDLTHGRSVWRPVREGLHTLTSKLQGMSCLCLLTSLWLIVHSQADACHKKHIGSKSAEAAERGSATLGGNRLHIEQVLLLQQFCNMSTSQPISLVMSSFWRLEDHAYTKDSYKDKNKIIFLCVEFLMIRNSTYYKDMCVCVWKDCVQGCQLWLFQARCICSEARKSI